MKAWVVADFDANKLVGVFPRKPRRRGGFWESGRGLTTSGAHICRAVIERLLGRPVPHDKPLRVEVSMKVYEKGA